MKLTRVEQKTSGRARDRSLIYTRNERIHYPSRDLLKEPLAEHTSLWSFALFLLVRSRISVKLLVVNEPIDQPTVSQILDRDLIELFRRPSFHQFQSAISWGSAVLHIPRMVKWIPPPRNFRDSCVEDRGSQSILLTRVSPRPNRTTPPTGLLTWKSK